MTIKKNNNLWLQPSFVLQKCKSAKKKIKKNTPPKSPAYLFTLIFKQL